MTVTPSLHVEVRGTGPDVILLHGFGASRFTWRYWTDRLARRHRLHLVDLKGFGMAARPPDGRYSPADFAEEVFDYTKRAGLRRYVLMGHSMGGGVALLASLLARESGGAGPHALVLVAAAAYPQRLPKLIGLATHPLLGPIFFGLIPARTIAKAGLIQSYHPERRPPAEAIAGYAKGLARPGGKRSLRWTASQLVPANLDAITARYPSIDVPTLLLWGDSDRVVPPWVGRRLARELPNARLVSLEECGHVPPEELPEESLSVVEDFLRDAVGGKEVGDPAGEHPGEG